MIRVVTHGLFAFWILLIPFSLLGQNKDDFKEDMSQQEALELYRSITEQLNAQGSTNREPTDHWDSLIVLYEAYPGLTTSLYEDAKLARDSIQGLIDHIEVLKLVLKEASEKNDSNGSSMNGIGFEESTRILIDEGKGGQLQLRIAETRAYLLSLASWTEEDMAYFENRLTLDSEFHEQMRSSAQRSGRNTWASYMFEEVPMLVVNVILGKFQGDARNTRLLMTDRLLLKAKAKVDSSKSY